MLEGRKINVTNIVVVMKIVLVIWRHHNFSFKTNESDVVQGTNNLMDI